MPPRVRAQPRGVPQQGDKGDHSLDLASQLVDVRAELAALQVRYDALHADRNRLAQMLEENMRKYKRFKRWVFNTKLKIPPKADKDRVGSSTPQPQSQAAAKMLETPITHKTLTFWHPSTPSQHERVTKRSQSSCPPTPKRAPAPHSPPPTKRPRRDVVEAVVPPARARGGSPPAINAEFEIDPVANAGVPFAFDEIVRGRQHRHALGAGECEECRDWYAAVGPLPPRLEAPRWSSLSPPRSSPTLVPSEGGSTTRREGAAAHRQAPTPPGYWNIGFPDTQAVEKINEQAAEIHRQKRAAIEREARDGGGRYRRRVP
ncbi:hypothetical protein EDB84DRAFT_1498441 [Lactarius hengduanensis]|nr:hypothetical protein EDB84DRAFT_1498441 [Lactarius hengduanensis]